MTLPAYLTVEVLAKAIDPAAFSYVPTGSEMDMKMKRRKLNVLGTAKSMMVILQRVAAENAGQGVDDAV